jgi:hypothetical protein
MTWTPDCIQIPKQLILGELQGELPADTVLAFAAVVLHTAATPPDLMPLLPGALAQTLNLPEDAVNTVLDFLDGDSLETLRDEHVDSMTEPHSEKAVFSKTVNIAPSKPDETLASHQEPLEDFISRRMSEVFPNAVQRTVPDIEHALQRDHHPNERDVFEDILVIMQETDGNKGIKKPDSYCLWMVNNYDERMHNQAIDIKQRGRSAASIIQEASRRTEVLLRTAEPPKATTTTISDLEKLKGKLSGKS